MATAELPAATVTCAACAKVAPAKPTRRGSARLPLGWKRHPTEPAAVYCPDCKAKLYRLRAVTFPVADVLEGGTWQEFTAALREAWARTGQLANWAVRQLLIADGERQPDQERIQPLPPVNLYRLWTDTYHDRTAWTGAAAAANAVLHQVEAKYRKARMDVIWRGSDRPPRYTYPTPYPCHNKTWQASYQETEGEDGQKMRVPVVKLNLGGRRWTIRLRGGPQRRRQLVAFAQIVSGEAIKGELAIYRQRSSSGSHRRTADEKAPGGGQTVKTRILVKLVAHLPVDRRGPRREGTLLVRTGRKALLVALAPGDERPWLYHADFLRRVIHQYDRRRQHISDDLKAEVRPASPALRNRMQAMAHRHGCRIDSELRRMAAMLVGYAGRRRVERLEYDDSDHRYFASFPWAKLKHYLAEACDRAGIVFADAAASGATVEATDVPDNHGSSGEQSS